MRRTLLVSAYALLLASCGGGIEQTEGPTPGAPTNAGTMTGSPPASPTPRRAEGDLEIVCGGTTEQPGIYTMHEDGSGVRRILSYGRDPAVSPEGDRVAFAATRHGSTDLYLMKTNGTHVRRLTHARGLHSDLEPAWSPDGERIAFVRLRGRGIGRGDIWILTLATGELARSRTRRCSTWRPTGPLMGPRSRSRASEPGRPIRRATGTSGPKTSPRGTSRASRGTSHTKGARPWSPNGSAIAFESDRGSARRSRIWVKEPGGQVEQLTRAGRNGDREPDWSPDGSRIVFVRGLSIRVLELRGGMTVIARGAGDRVYASPSWRVA